ncbi:unnamed protein product [Closterium sp. NIES-54]
MDSSGGGGGDHAAMRSVKTKRVVANGPSHAPSSRIGGGASSPRGDRQATLWSCIDCCGSREPGSPRYKRPRAVTLTLALLFALLLSAFVLLIIRWPLEERFLHSYLGTGRAAPVECIPNAAQGFSGEGVFAKREKKQQKKRPNQAQQQEQQEEAEEKLPSNHVQLFDQEEQEGGGTEQESGAAATRPFVYQLTSKVLKLELEWYSEQYDLEKHLMEMLMRRTDNPVRTTDPEQASLFFVPFYVSRYLFSFFHNDKKNMRQCIEKSSRVGVF